ncbi:hypothetical protein RB195_020335 [Necator americanus]|uniref:Sushi domain-containing protein n=1 Tax=Necator americanus TaxID=51031 RepID=A0ABR1CLV9_NECAM
MMIKFCTLTCILIQIAMHICFARTVRDVYSNSYQKEDELDRPERTRANISNTPGFEPMDDIISNYTTNELNTTSEPYELKNWTTQAVTVNDCPALIPSSNSTLSYSDWLSTESFPIGTLVTMRCTSGYPEGPVAASCYEGKWVPATLGSCSGSVEPGRANCYAVTVHNGMLIYSDENLCDDARESGSKAFLTCYAGYIPNGSSSTYCHNGEWTPPLGNCIKQRIQFINI